MKMSRLSMLQPWSQLTSWQGGSPVKMSPSLASKSVSSKEPDQDSGENLPDSFAHYDPATSSWRTSQGCLFSQDLELYSETWPAAGTMRNGKCYPQPPLEPLTYESESGLWLGTPRATEAIRSERFKKGRTPSPEEYVKMWPTPRANKIGGYSSEGYSPTLEQRVSWPTPSAQMAGEGPLLDTLQTKEGEPAQPGERAYNPKTGKHVQMTLNRSVKMWPTPDSSPRGTRAMDLVENASTVRRRGSGQRRGMDLQTAVKMWPTPTEDDGSNVNPNANRRKGLCSEVKAQEGSGRLNPQWVSWLMGYPVDWCDLPGELPPKTKGG